MELAAVVGTQDSTERRGAGTLQTIQQVAITAVFTFTCYTVPVLWADSADDQDLIEAARGASKGE